MILYLECYLLIEGASGCSLDFLRANKGMKLQARKDKGKPKKFSPLRHGKMQRHDHFSEKFLELSAACPCRRAASCQFCTGKSHGGALLPLVKNTRNKNQTHTSLSECPINENRSKTFSKTSKVVVAKMTKPGTKAKKAKSENEVPLPNGSLPPKPNIMYIEVNLYAKNNTYHTQNYTRLMLSHPHHLRQERR